MSWPSLNGVQTHDRNPAVNVKVHRQIGIGVRDELAKRGVPEDVIDEALEFAWECAVEDFWRYWMDSETTEHYFGKNHGLTIECGGRSGGWLEVIGLPNIEEWTEEEREKLDEFVKDVEDDVRYRTSDEYLLESIDCNEVVEQIQKRQRIDAAVSAYRKQLEATL